MQHSITPGAAFGTRTRCVASVPRTLLILVIATLSLALAGARPAAAISRDTVLARAQTWIDSPVAYSQTRWYGGYRTDCSGYASMCWSTGFSWCTRTMHSVASSITVDQLQPGDALLKAGTHIRIFRGWVDDAHVFYVAYEQTSPRTKSSIRSVLADLANGYVPYRYDRITAAAAPRNLVVNPSFDVWAAPVGITQAEPVWWNIGGMAGVQVTARRQDAVVSGHNAAQLINTSTSSARSTMISQVVTVTPDTTYAVTAWARTAANPALVTLTVAYLDADGTQIAATRTAGSSWGIGAAGFGRMGVTLAAPAGAVTARIELRLGGGTTTVATQTVPGTSALVDDVCLQRPYSAAMTSASRTTVRYGYSSTITSRVTVPGSVVPTAAAGQTVRVYVMAPGRTSWSLWRTARASVSGAAAATGAAYRFKRGMRLGAYRFKTVIAPWGDFLGSTSPVAVVSLR